MSTCDVTRVYIDVDDHWDKGFIPWLEVQEMNGIGRQDGVFVVSVP